MTIAGNNPFVTRQTFHFSRKRKTFGTPRMYALSPSKSIKGSNYGEFLKDKNVLLCIDDIIKTAVKTAEVDEQKTKYLPHLQQSCQIKRRYKFHLYPAFIRYVIFPRICGFPLPRGQVWPTCSQIYFRFSSYLLRKPYLFIILTAIGWFIASIQSDLFWHRCLERQTFGTPRIYALSPSKSIKGSNYGESMVGLKYCSFGFKQ
jgi:hypothetical protein